jgi:hypothetical protein
VGDHSRARFATPADFPRHDYSHVPVRCDIWALSLVQGPFSVAPAPSPRDSIRFDSQRFPPLSDGTWGRHLHDGDVAHGGGGVQHGELLVVVLPRVGAHVHARAHGVALVPRTAVCEFLPLPVSLRF